MPDEASYPENVLSSSSIPSSPPGAFQRLWLAFWYAVWGSASSPALEASLSDVARLRGELKAVRDELARERLDWQARFREHAFELRVARSEVAAAAKEVEVLAMVVERNRMRVEAETAGHARDAAVAVGERPS